MRLIAALLMFATFVFSTAHAQIAGAYASPAAAAADDCIKLCQDDTLCVGWTYAGGVCGLWASVPKQAPSAFTLSSRAPSFAQDMTTTPVVQAVAPAPPSPPQPHHEQAAVALLGGDNRTEDLRPRFGGGT